MKFVLCLLFFHSITMLMYSKSLFDSIALQNA